MSRTPREEDETPKKAGQERREIHGWIPNIQRYWQGGDGFLNADPTGPFVFYRDIERFLPHAGNDLPKDVATVLVKITSKGDENGSWFHAVSLGGTSWLRRDMRNVDLERVVAWMHAP